MGFLNIIRNSRYHLNPSHFHCTCISPVSDPAYSAIFSSGCPLFYRNFVSIASKSNLLCNFSYGSVSFAQSSRISDKFRNDLLRFSCGFRLYSTSVAIDNDSGTGSNKPSGEKGGTSRKCEVSPSVIKSMIDIVKNDASDMEERLGLMGQNLSKWSIIEVFGVLNTLNVPALRFFDWVRDAHPQYFRNADLCSLAVDNCGRLGDFSTLRILLSDFRDRKVSLSSKAFGFLKISDGTTSEEAKKSILEIVGLLNEVGGSCRNSGIHSLITMLCSLDMVEWAKFVVEITDRKASYYNVLVKHLCVEGQLEVAQDLLGEMSRLSYGTASTAYNYLISSLCMLGRIDIACSIPGLMTDRGCLPDQLTFEMLIYFSCRYGRSGDAGNLYDEMLSRGIRPRIPTHSAFIRGFVSAKRFDEAYTYIVNAAVKVKWAAPHMYNILASLHIEHGDLLIAHKLLAEMIEKGLYPKLSVLRRASNRLHKTGRSELAKSLDACYSSLTPKSDRILRD